MSEENLESLAAEAQEELPQGQAGEKQIEEKEVKSEEKVIFRGREFASQKEAMDYFEKLEDDNRAMERARIEAESYNQGLRDAMSQAGIKQGEVSQAEEENLEEQFYADPQGTLKKIEERAIQRAEERINQKIQQKESESEAWNVFSSEHPDLADSKAEVIRILQENPHLLQVRDQQLARKELAQKTRSYFQGIAERFAPARELPNKKGQAVSSGSSAAPSVTQTKENERPLTFVEQLKQNRRRV